MKHPEILKPRRINIPPFLTCPRCGRYLGQSVNSRRYHYRIFAPCAGVGLRKLDDRICAVCPVDGGLVGVMREEQQ